jgi:hypothetical protein
MKKPLSTILPCAGSETAGSGRARVNSKWVPLLWIGLLLGVAGTGSANGQQYAIDWYKIAGGGGTSTGGVYSVSGTIGQHDAGLAMSGGNYTVTGGFWSLLAVVQTPGAPLLTITHSGDNMIVSWPVSPGGFTLQQNGNMANAAGWSAYGGTVSTTNGVNSITLTPPGGNLFFRLSNP